MKRRPQPRAGQAFGPRLRLPPRFWVCAAALGVALTLRRGLQRVSDPAWVLLLQKASPTHVLGSACSHVWPKACRRQSGLQSRGQLCEAHLLHPGPGVSASREETGWARDTRRPGFLSQHGEGMGG